MKKNIKVFALIAVLFLAQSCGTKTDKSSEESKVKVTPAETVNLSSIEQRRAFIKKDSAMIAEKRMKAWNEMYAKTPTYTNPTGTVIYRKAEVNPVFTGGDKAMRKYLRDNIVYPAQAQKDELEGAVFVDFVVGADGTVSDVEVTDATSADVNQAFRNEAFRVVSSMPKWTPGLQNNKPVNVKYSIPITFQII
ncbi:MAG: energy transducer TonB [Imperialibacter sp.]|uniref:energy transducer TonB n=1 Tax=Imperialibacter sp. TaxID=2038411 RepID=UPI0032EB4FC3